jgi:SAM-dependent methyltransferase
VINYDRLYDFRFRGVDQSSRERVWTVIADDIYTKMGRPAVVLDPAAGRGEFINAIPAGERWIVDRVAHPSNLDPNVKTIIADIFEAELPPDYFDGVFVSNFLEHLPTQDSVAELLAKLHQAMQPGGRIAVMGPNFKYCAKEYFDCADHTLALTHLAVEEHVYAAGFVLGEVRSRYLPYSFRGLLPPSPALTGAYLRLPVAQRVLGKQFLIIADKP